jgi:hypothetical protein
MLLQVPACRYRDDRALARARSIKTTYMYQHADNKLKQEAIDRTAPIGTPPGRDLSPDQLLAFLESL